MRTFFLFLSIFFFFCTIHMQVTVFADETWSESQTWASGTWSWTGWPSTSPWDTSTQLNSKEFLINTSSWEGGKDKDFEYANTTNCDPSKDNCATKTAKWDSQSRTQELLRNIMQKLMIGMALVTTLLIVIGGGCLVFSGGSDGIKTRGKNILIAGILSLAIAMCSAIIINLVWYILYRT